MSLGAGLADIAALGIKVVHALEDKALSYQGLKLAGGVLSAGAAWINFQNDFDSGDKKYQTGQHFIGFLYYGKGVGNLLIGAASAFNGISYAKPAFDMIARKFPATALGRSAALVPRAAAYIARIFFIQRAFLICGGLYINLAVLAIELLIWKFSDDELQKWCKHSAFGLEKYERNLSAPVQALRFESALKEIL